MFPRSAYVLGLLMALPVRAQAQAPARDPFAALATDSSAWQKVLVHIVSSLASNLVAASADSAPQAWTIRLPDSAPQRSLLERQLRTVFRARAPFSSDSVVRSLTIGPLIVVGDSGYIRVHFDFSQRCAGSARTTGYGNVDSVVVPRDPRIKAWGAARTVVVEHGDRGGC
jgi:hypothetical protein